jgi:serine phosphatase RsbU (regulator of sigma subunit)
MLKPPLPDDDFERAEDLRRLGILLTEPETALDHLTQQLAQIFDVPGAYISFIDEDTQYYKSEFGGLPEPFAKTRTEPREVSLCSYVVGINDELIVEDLLDDVRFRDNPAVVNLGVRFYAGAPLHAESGRAVGSLCIVDMKPRKVSPRERDLLRLVAEGAMAMVKLQVASRQLLDRSQLIERDLQQAVQVQQFLLPPKRVEGDGWKIEHLYRPVDHLGGDFVDFYERPDGRWALLIADVSGHGTSAALTTAMTKTAFRRVASWVGTPAQLLDAMHRELDETIPPGQFITAIAVLFAPASRQLSISSAGHPYPLHISAGGEKACFVEHNNELPLCVDSSTSYHEQTDVVLAPGERVLIYTDGTTEAQDSDGGMLGTNGFAELVARTARNAHSDPSITFLESIFADLQQHATGHLSDDVALLCVEAL